MLKETIIIKEIKMTDNWARLKTINMCVMIIFMANLKKYLLLFFFLFFLTLILILK